MHTVVVVTKQEPGKPMFAIANGRVEKLKCAIESIRHCARDIVLHNHRFIQKVQIPGRQDILAHGDNEPDLQIAGKHVRVRKTTRPFCPWDATVHPGVYGGPREGVNTMIASDIGSARVAVRTKARFFESIPHHSPHEGTSVDGIRKRQNMRQRIPRRPLKPTAIDMVQVFPVDRCVFVEPTATR